MATTFSNTKLVALVVWRSKTFERLIFLENSSNKKRTSLTCINDMPFARIPPYIVQLLIVMLRTVATSTSS